MNIVRVVLAVVIGAGGCATEASPVPGWYYTSACQQPEGVGLYDWLGNLEWYGEIDLSGGGWDCSQMSARIEWLCENCGYDAVITCREGTDESRGHCWVTVEGEPYEATGLYWVDLETADPDYYRADLWFHDVYEAWEYDGRLSEWGWWRTYPALVGRN